MVAVDIENTAKSSGKLMDKELLRIAIIATGLVIIVGMVISAYLKDKQAREDELEFYDDEDDEFEDEFEDDVMEEKSNVSLKKVSVTQVLKDAYAQKMKPRQKVSPQVDIDEKIAPEFDEPEKIDEVPVSRPAVAAAIIQFSVITKGNDDFNGADIFEALEELGLEYGSTKIFERIGEDRLVHFGVASMVEPGPFPDEDIELFYCPGVTFFMQVDGLDDPVAVFDDYVSTIVLFAQRMNGVVLDHRRQVLTQEMVEAIRQGLSTH
ncbi:MAG: cell division protein ZipA C-terminal FtsZ-binding domain-containing protein [Methylococcales bacterium]|nr:cell division protein ZipA C-terminal FtsZ-binding domain-containing protein [Methylococcales bacterium]